MGAYEDDMDYALKQERMMGDLEKDRTGSGRFDEEHSRKTLSGDPVPQIMVSDGRMTTTVAKPTLTLDTPDSNNYRPDRTQIGTQWRHTNGKVYRIVGYQWDGDADRWLIAYKNDDEVITCTRGAPNFFAHNAQGHKRFTPVR